MCPRCGSVGPRLTKTMCFLPRYLFKKKVLTSGSLELMKEQALAAFNNCHVVGVTQDDASRIERCKGTPIWSGVSSELAIELLPACPGH